VLPGQDVHGSDLPGARGADGVFHFHRFQDAQLTPDSDLISGTYSDRSNHARDRRPDDF
jgi:hypothetical protein